MIIQKYDPSEERVKALLFGASGTGKTSVAVSASQHPDLSPVWVLDTEGGLKSVSGLSGVIHSPINSAEELKDALYQIARPPESREEIVRDVKTVVIDSVHFLRDRSLVGRTLQNEPGRASPRRPYSPEQSDYMITGNQIFNFLVQAQQFVHIIMTCNEDDSGGALGVSRIKPGVNRDLREKITYFSDWIWYTTVSDKGNFGVVTSPGNKYNAEVKVRSDRFAEVLRKDAGGEGWKLRSGIFVSEYAGFPTFPTLFDLYKKSIS
jgi:hypothetical protein